MLNAKGAEAGKRMFGLSASDDICARYFWGADITRDISGGRI